MANQFKIRCKCGALIIGSSEKHAKANMKNHLLSKKHKELMEIREAWTKEQSEK